MIRLLIVDDIASTRENLQKLLSFESDIEVVATAGDGREAIEKAHEVQPDVIVMDVNMPVLDGIQATEQLAQELPSSPVIIMSVQGERDYLRRAMQAGAREFLIKPFSHDELVAAVRRVYELEQRKGTYLSRTTGGPVAAAPPEQSGPADVIAVLSGKGGVGKSVVASNLAVAIAAETNARVCLIDLDLQFGDIGVMLNIDHTRSITDLLEAGETIEQEVFDDVLATGPRNLKVLLAPTSPELADLVNADLVHRVIAQLRNQFNYIVVDTSSHLSEFNLEVIEIAKQILVVTSLTIPAIKDAKLTLKVLESLNVERDKIQLVVNRIDGFSDFNKDAIESNLRYPVSAQLPHEPRVVSDSVTKGTPFVELQPEAEISRAMRELVARVVPHAGVAGQAADSDKKKRRGLLRR